jgi:hypothetical protein
MNHHKKPERRTFLQDRFEILIKRQKTGEASFNELTELDEIVNTDPEIRNMVIRENLLQEEIDGFNEPSNKPEISDNLYIPQVQRRNLLNRIKSFIARIFTSQFSTIKTGNLIVWSGLIAF